MSIIVDMKGRTYSSRQVAASVGISYRTLFRWYSDGKVAPSQVLRLDGRKLLRWTSADVERVRKWKAAHYRKGRGRKKRKS